MAKLWISVLAVFCMALAPKHVRAAVSIPLTVTLSEAVTVTGSPQIAVDVGGTARYAVYSGGTGTNTLTFTLSPQTGDVDLDGIAVASPILLNGGTIKDTAGNDATLTFTPPNTAGIKINYPSLSMDFVYDADGRYTLNGTAYDNLTSFMAAAGGTFTRASVGTYYDSAGTLQTASAETPRFDWDPVTHAAKGILIEESRINLIKHGDDFTVSPWANAVGGTSSRVNSNTSFYNAAALVTATSAGGGIRQSIGGLAAKPYVWSFYIESSNTTSLVFRLENGNAAYGTYCGVTFNPSTGTFSSLLGYTQLKAKALGSGWLIELILPTAAGGFVANLEILGNNGTIFKYALPQFEQGAFATSYIPTTAVSVTRSEDNLSIPTGSWYNSAAGTASGDYTPNGIGSSTVAGLYYFASASYPNDAATTRLLNTGNVYSSFSNSSGTLYIPSIIGATGVSVGTRIKAAQTIKSGDYALSVNGGAVATNAATSLPSPTRVDIGSRSGGGGQKPNGPVRNFEYFPLRVSDAQLRLLTQ